VKKIMAKNGLSINKVKQLQGLLILSGVLSDWLSFCFLLYICIWSLEL